MAISMEGFSRSREFMVPAAVAPTLCDTVDRSLSAPDAPAISPNKRARRLCGTLVRPIQAEEHGAKRCDPSNWNILTSAALIQTR